jgi:TolB protein
MIVEQTCMKVILPLLLLAVFGTASFSASAAEAMLPGHIAFVGTDRNIYQIDMSTNEIEALTQDASQNRFYGFTTWSSDNRLAYILQDVTTDTKSTDVFISKDGLSPGSRVYSTTTEGFTYAYWSPQNCAEGENCRNLAILTSNPMDGLFSVHLINDMISGSKSTLIGRGAPFYFSWSPDGGRMLWQRDNQRLDIYDVSADKVQALPFAVGAFQAPAWSPVDDRWLIGTQSQDESKTTLAIVSDVSQQPLVEDLTGPVAFSWSPDGNHVAYIDGVGTVIVLNSVTGRIEARSPVSGVYAFFWSPNSNLLAYITLGIIPGSIADRSEPKLAVIAQTQPTIAWSVLDIVNGSNRRFGSFTPTAEMVYLLRFFDQFSQSHRVWSPDSRYLLYSEDGASGPSINVLDILHEETVPFSIAQGYFGVWSFN